MHIRLTEDVAAVDFVAAAGVVNVVDAADDVRILLLRLGLLDQKGHKMQKH